MTRRRTPPMTWRPATPADEPAVARLWAALNAEDPAERPPAAHHLARTFAALRAEPARGRVVVLASAEGDSRHGRSDGGASDHGRSDGDGRDGGRDVFGYALLMAFWDNEQGGEICVVDELYVAPAARGRGHASALLRALRDGCALWPRRPVAIDLEVSPDNAAAARLYARLDFAALRNRPLRLLLVPPTDERERD